MVNERQAEPEVARRSARPVTGRRLPAALFGARMAAKSAPRGAREIGAAGPGGAFSRNANHSGTVGDIVASKRSLLVTYRRDGTPVPTPVWAAVEEGRLYVRSERAAGKVKRLRNDSRLLVAPCTVRGKPLGPAFEATAVTLPPEREAHAEGVLARRYGWGRALFERVMDVLRVDMGYLEITPGPWEQAT
jgi:PPOX class probable F420-dependent enzyme